MDPRFHGDDRLFSMIYGDMAVEDAEGAILAHAQDTGFRKLKKGHVLTRDDVVLTPHIGGATFDTEANHSTLIADGLAALLAGKVPTHIANPEVLQ